MSALTDRIAAEHGGWFNLDGVWRCNCGEPLPSSANADMWMRAHIATVTEAAVREQVARKIRAQRDRFRWLSDLEKVAYDTAARIADGVTP